VNAASSRVSDNNDREKSFMTPGTGLDRKLAPVAHPVHPCPGPAEPVKGVREGLRQPGGG